MQTIELECPSCAELLELDAGFAGGVCRCSGCGTLMTVPSDAGKAEQLTSPDEDMSGTQSMTPDRPRPSSRRKSSKSKSSKRSKKKPATSSVVEAGEYRTQTGKVIKIDAPTRVPMAASKKKQIRIVTGVVFFGIVAAVVGVAVFVIISIMGEGDAGKDGAKDTAKDGQKEVAPPDPEYIEGLNPYTLGFSNVAGIPLEGTVVLVVEASTDSARWMPEVSDMIVSGVKRGDGGGARISFFGALKADPVPWGGDSADLVEDLSAKEIAGWFEKLPKKELSGQIDFGWPATEALKADPDAIVFVVSGLSVRQVEQIEKAMEDDEGVDVHIVLVEGFQPDLGSLQKENSGLLVSLTSRQVSEWKDEASEGEEDESED